MFNVLLDAPLKLSTVGALAVEPHHGTRPHEVGSGRTHLEHVVLQINVHVDVVSYNMKVETDPSLYQWTNSTKVSAVLLGAQGEAILTKTRLKALQ